ARVRRSRSRSAWPSRRLRCRSTTADGGIKSSSAAAASGMGCALLTPHNRPLEMSDKVRNRVSSNSPYFSPNPAEGEAPGPVPAAGDHFQPEVQQALAGGGSQRLAVVPQELGQLVTGALVVTVKVLLRRRPIDSLSVLEQEVV